jgi:putative endonuclease
MYILECGDGTFYTGSTKDLARRFVEHLNGLGSIHTAKHFPIKLVYCEYFKRIDHAYDREKQIQRWRRAKKIALVEGRNYALPKLARNPENTYHNHFIPPPED